MAGANHRRDRTLALLGSWPVGSIGTDRPPARVSECGGNRFLLGKLTSIGAFFLVNSRDHERLADPPFAITAPGERPRLGKCKRSVIDIAKPDHPVGELFYGWLAIFVPAPFAQFAVQIGNEFRPAGGKPSDITQRQFFQLFRR